MDQSSVNASTVSLSLSLFLPISFIIDLLRQHLRYSFVSIHSFALTAFNAIFRGLFAFESIQHRRDETQSDIKQSNHSVKSYESVNSPFFFWYISNTNQLILILQQESWCFTELFSLPPLHIASGGQNCCRPSVNVGGAVVVVVIYGGRRKREFDARASPTEWKEPSFLLSLSGIIISAWKVADVRCIRRRRRRLVELWPALLMRPCKSLDMSTWETRTQQPKIHKTKWLSTTMHIRTATPSVSAAVWFRSERRLVQSILPRFNESTAKVVVETRFWNHFVPCGRLDSFEHGTNRGR